MTVTRYVLAVDSTEWGDRPITDDEHQDACERATDWLTDHEDDDLSVEFRPTRRSEIAGLYRVDERGDYRLLDGEFRPDDVCDLIRCAWDHALRTWP